MSFSPSSPASEQIIEEMLLRLDAGNSILKFIEGYRERGSFATPSRAGKRRADANVAERRTLRNGRSSVGNLTA